MSNLSIKNPNNRFDLIASRIKYGTDGGINVDSGALYVNGSNGRVGVGTTSPQTSLDVSGSVRTSGNISLSGRMDISGYYQVNGVPINNSFYPALSNATADNAISSWQLRTHVSNQAFRGCCWSSELNLFVAVSSQGTNNRISTSTDGILWTERDTSGADLFWRSVCWSREVSKFIAVASTGTGKRVYDSSNGITWTLRETPADNEWTSVIWARELGFFVAVSQTGEGNNVMTSPDGIIWTLRTTPSNISWRSICWSPELRLLVAVANSGNNRIMTSPDAITWTLQNTPELIFYNSVCWSPELGLFVAVSQTGTTGSVITSNDGINWTLRQSIISGWNSVTWSPQLRIFVAVAESGTRLMYSNNGITWSGIPLTDFVNYNSLCWSPELGIFIYVGRRFTNPTNTLIVTSSLSGRPPTSFNVFDSSFNNINELGLWNFQSFGRFSSVTKTGDFVVQPGENWIICNGTGTITVTLPAAASWPGDEIMIKTVAAQAVNSFNNNVVPLSGGAVGNAILSANAGRWATLVSDGTNWIIMNGVI